MKSFFVALMDSGVLVLLRGNDKENYFSSTSGFGFLFCIRGSSFHFVRIDKENYFSSTSGFGFLFCIRGSSFHFARNDKEKLFSGTLGFQDIVWLRPEWQGIVFSNTAGFRVIVSLRTDWQLKRLVSWVCHSRESGNPREASTRFFDIFLVGKWR